MTKSGTESSVATEGADSSGSGPSAGRAAPEMVRRALLAWYDRHARDLPWRRTDDPYAIWVSEIMLQQTRVDTVVPYWERWMERYATVEALADADLEEVLKSWEGLGYYRRARMLHRAAGVVRDRHGGRLPDEADALRELPGVGEYTAGAVASIAFGRAEPAVDGNVRRVLARLDDRPDPGAAELRDRAAELVDPERPGDFNQALMELGAVVCTPGTPDCPACPLEAHCLARARGVQEERPLPTKRAAVPERRFGVAVPWRRSGDGVEVLLVRRPEDGMLGGLWAFPATRLEADDDPLDGARRAAAAALGRNGPGEQPSGTDARPTMLDEVRHSYSHFRGVYLPVLLEEPGRPAPAAGEARWHALGEAEALPLPVAQRRILEAATAAIPVGERGVIDD